MPQKTNSYLEAQVKTATPQKLQLILIEAAIRFVKKAQMHREQEDEAAACEAIGRAHKIVTEIIGGLRPEVDPELVGRVAPIYVFVARSLAQAFSPENHRKLDDAIRVLEEEQTTWKLVCEQIAAESAGQNDAAVLDQRANQNETANDIDSIAIHATAGNAAHPVGTPLSPSMATYAPVTYSPAGHNYGISAPSHLSGPKMMSTEKTTEPITGGFSIDA